MKEVLTLRIAMIIVSALALAGCQNAAEGRYDVELGDHGLVMIDTRTGDLYLYRDNTDGVRAWILQTRGPRPEVE